MRFVEFQAPNRSAVFVNPDHVAIVLAHGWESGVSPTTILRTEAGDLIVQGDVHEVVKRLKEDTP